MFDVENLFSDVGQKIKKWALWIYKVSVAFLLVAGAIGIFGSLIVIADDVEMIWLLLAVPIGVVIGILSTLVSCWLLYAFGEITDTAIKNRNMENISKAKTSVTAFTTVSTAKAEWVCEICNAKMKADAHFCEACGANKPTQRKQVVNDGWKCTCGKMNPKYVSTCSCGKSAREVREQKNKSTSVKSTAVEEKAIAMGVCPDCGAQLEKTDMDNVMMCPDCGRMFG